MSGSNKGEFLNKRQASRRKPTEKHRSIFGRQSTNLRKTSLDKNAGISVQGKIVITRPIDNRHVSSPQHGGDRQVAISPLNCFSYYFANDVDNLDGSSRLVKMTRSPFEPRLQHMPNAIPVLSWWRR